jgi:hypothetical protein
VKKPYIEIALEKWDDLVEFSEKVGILEEVEGIYKNGRMFGGFGKRLEGRNLNRLEEFIVGLIRAVNSEHLNFSRDLNLEDERDTPDGVVQIGWSSVKVSLDMESTTIIMTFHHSLRSVDVHNGLPYNLYYCVKISEYILNKVREESGKDVKAGVIFISLGNLHAYYDNIARVTNLTKTKPARLPLNDTLKTE